MNRTIQTFIYELEHQTIGSDDRNALPHHDRSVEIIQFWSDGGSFLVRNNIFPITPGTILLINAMENHYSNPANIAKYNRSKIILSSECFDTLCRLCDFSDLADKLTAEGGCIFSFDPASNSALQADALFREAAHCFQPGQTIPSAQADIMSRVIQILSLLAMAPHTIVKKESTEHTFQLMIDHINNQLISWEDITLSSICDALHISRSYAAHLFKQLTSKSITQYVTDLRIAEAKKLLLSTDLKVFDIAEMLKFKDSTTFCKTFKKHTGYTPRTYRLSNGSSLPDSSAGHATPEC